MVGAGSSVSEVCDWLQSNDALRDRVKDVQTTVELFDDAGVDGNLLATISAEELQALVGISDEEEVDAILSARDAAFADTEEGSQVGEPAAGAGPTQEHKYPPLYKVVKRKDTAMVLQMLKDGVDPNDPAEASPCTSQLALQRTPLHLAGLYRLPDIMAALLEYGAAVNCTDNNSWSTLHYAALSGDGGLARLLLAAGADASIITNGGGALGDVKSSLVGGKIAGVGSVDGDGTNLSEGCLADNLSELEVVPNPDQRDVAEWSEESEEDNSDSDEDESCAWLYERW
eukprot:COSAG02_NODE_3035_length_7502_cov_6.521680_2_plen_286_part_00